MKKNSIKKTAKKVIKEVKDKTKKGIEKTKEAYNSPTGKKVREWIKEKSKIITSHLAAIKVGLSLSDEESKLLERLKNDLNKKNIFPSKSEIIRAGLWSLRNLKSGELEKSINDLIKVKQTRVL